MTANKSMTAINRTMIIIAYINVSLFRLLPSGVLVAETVADEVDEVDEVAYGRKKGCAL